MTLRASSSDSVELAIHDLGGEGPPLLFVHATGFHGRCYTRIAEQLGDIRRCWAPDLRAHGDSTIPADDRFHWSGMADDLCAVLDALGIDEPVDFVELVAQRHPLRVLCTILGVPEADEDRLLELTSQLFAFDDPDVGRPGEDRVARRRGRRMRTAVR